MGRRENSATSDSGRIRNASMGRERSKADEDWSLPARVPSGPDVVSGGHGHVSLHDVTTQVPAVCQLLQQKLR